MLVEQLKLCSRASLQLMQSLRLVCEVAVQGQWLVLPFTRQGGSLKAALAPVSALPQQRGVTGSAAPAPRKEVLHPDFVKEFKGRKDHFPCLSR